MNYWSRQQNGAISQSTIEIVELVRGSVPLSEWPDKTRQKLAIALFPRRHADQDGRWTEEAAAAMKLLKHAFRRSSYLNLPAEIQQMMSANKDDISEPGSDHSLDHSLLVEAHYIRRELPGIIPPWSMEYLLGSVD